MHPTTSIHSYANPFGDDYVIQYLALEIPFRNTLGKTYVFRPPLLPVSLDLLTHIAYRPTCDIKSIYEVYVLSAPHRLGAVGIQTHLCEINQWCHDHPEHNWTLVHRRKGADYQKPPLWSKVELLDLSRHTKLDVTATMAVYATCDNSKLGNPPAGV